MTALVPAIESRSFYAKAKGLGCKGIDALARYYGAVLDFLGRL